MCRFRELYVLGVCAVAAFFCSPLAARAEESEPSIEEMWAKIEAHLGSEAAAGAATEGRPGPSLEAESRERRSPRYSSGPRKLDFAPLLKRLNARARERLEIAKREDDQAEMARVYLRLEAFDNAAKSLLRALNSSSTARQYGWIEAEYAIVMVHLGQQRVAEQYVARSEKLLDEALERHAEDLGASEVRELRGAYNFVKNYPEARKKFAELTASMAEAPDENKQWEFVNMCDPVEGKVRLAMKWLVGVHTMRLLYPDHPANHDGRSDAELSQAYRHHELYEECIAHVTQLLENKPWTLQYIGSGRAHWDRAYSQELLARHHYEMRERQRALAGFRKALEYFQEFQKKLPGCRYNRRGEKDGRPSYVETRIQRIHEEIGNTRSRW